MTKIPPYYVVQTKDSVTVHSALTVRFQNWREYGYKCVPAKSKREAEVIRKQLLSEA